MAVGFTATGPLHRSVFIKSQLFFVGIDNFTLPTLNNYGSADAEEDLITVQSPQTVKKKVPKLVPGVNPRRIGDRFV
jgi:hypothetical protein